MPRARRSTDGASALLAGAAALALAFACAVAGCTGERPSGLGGASSAPGPRVVWDLETVPLPQIPLPNDLATRYDNSSSTGRRLNLPTTTMTRFEATIRSSANRLEGFSTYGAISVPFDAPLDLVNLRDRQTRGRAVAERAVLLVNVDRSSERFGAIVPLDVGHGNFPATLPVLDAYWPRDSRRTVENLLFDATDEDKNGNGKLDPGEDTDNDGYLDVPNLLPGVSGQKNGTMTFYERVTNTMIVRPLMPLRQQTRYAVVLTTKLLGADGNPVRSPWPLVNHSRQSGALAPLPEVLEKHGLSGADVAFAWSFTTQAVSRDLEALRAGLYGHGRFAYLKDEFPPDLAHLAVRGKDAAAGADLRILPASQIQEMIRQFGPALGSFAGIGQRSTEAVALTLRNVDYFVAGTLRGPNLLADKDGHAAPGYPADSDEVWQMDRTAGTATYQSHAIPFLCAIPRKDRGKGPPFDVTFYHHGYTSSRIEMLGFVGVVARYGVATCGIDAYGHGLQLPTNLQLLAKKAFQAFGLGPMIDQLFPGRARDINNDGQVDSGGDFFSTDLFHTRDMVRQSVLDTMVLIRALRAFDGTRKQRDGDGKTTGALAGDFDGDGKVDIGGPDATYTTWGTSLGGILSSIVAGIEPAITAAAPQAGGGGLVDIPGRSTVGGMPEATILPAIGPLFVGEPDKEKKGIKLRAIVTTANKWVDLTIANQLDIRPGDRVVVENLTSGFTYTARAAADGGFRLHVAADALSADEKRVRFGFDPSAPKFEPARAADTLPLGDQLVIRVYSGEPTGVVANDKPRLVIDRFGVDVEYEGVIYPAGQPLVALTRGLGLGRNTPAFRQILGLAQLSLDPGDPINYAPFYGQLALPADYDTAPTAKPGANVLVIVTAGDTAVPAATGIAIARAAGVIDIDKVDARYGKTANQVLIDSYAIEGLSRLRRFDGKRVVMDVEDFSAGTHAPDVPRLDPPLRLTTKNALGGGVSALRIPLLDPKGQHAFLVPTPDDTFDNNTFMIHMVGRFLSSGGKDLRDDFCMHDASCDWIPPRAPAAKK